MSLDVSFFSKKERGAGELITEHGFKVVVRSKGYEMLSADSVAVLVLLRSRSSGFCLGDGLPAVVPSFLLKYLPLKRTSSERAAVFVVVVTSGQFHLKRP